MSDNNEWWDDDDLSVPTIPDYGQDARWDDYYDAMGHAELWASPCAPPWLPLWAHHAWIKLPLLVTIWQRWGDPMRLAVVWWWYTRWHSYPTDADWQIDA